MSKSSTPARYIREQIFCVETQGQFGDLLGVTQETISRYETGALRLNVQAQDRIRKLAAERGIDWDNNWFYDIPQQPKSRREGRAA